MDSDFLNGLAEVGMERDCKDGTSRKEDGRKAQSSIIFEYFRLLRGSGTFCYPSLFVSCGLWFGVSCGVIKFYYSWLHMLLAAQTHQALLTLMRTRLATNTPCHIPQAVCKCLHNALVTSDSITAG